MFPTLAHIALDVLPSQASSVPCERIFSGTKQIADDRRSRIGPIIFEELTIMKSAWRAGLWDYAMLNTAEVEEVAMQEFEQLLYENIETAVWDKESLS